MTRLWLRFARWLGLCLGPFGQGLATTAALRLYLLDHPNQDAAEWDDVALDRLLDAIREEEL